MGNLAQDIRYAIRMLAKKPAFAAVAVVALTLGIGANTAIFSVVNAVLLRPLPYPHPEQLMLLWGVRDDRGHLNASYPDFADFRDQSQTLEYVAAYQPTGILLTGGDEPEALQGSLVSADMFPLLGVSPALGRAFTREEDKTGAPRVVVIGHGLWNRRFAADADIIGKEIFLSTRPYTVIGVMPPDFKFPADVAKTEFLLPFAPTNADILTRRGSHSFYIAARLKSGVTIEEAKSEVGTIAGRMAEAYPDTNARRGATLAPMHDDLVSDVRPSLFILLAAVAFVLLIACANVANLLLARAASRQKEIAIRTAVGASRIRIIRQLLTESLLLSLMGGAGGMLMALWGVDLLISASPGNIPRLKEITLDGRVLAFTILVSMLTGLIFGIAPALGASKPDLNEVLKEGGRGGESARRASLRSLLVISEVAICLVLLIGAGLLIKSFIRLLEINPGFNPDNVVTVNLAPPRAKYPQPEQTRAFFQQVIERAKELPGVESASLVNMLPLEGSNQSITFRVEGRPIPAPGTYPVGNFRKISPDYFRTMQIPLLRGRAPSDSDTKDTPHVIVINESLARVYFPDEDPIGKRILIGDDNPPPHEIIGIVGDIRHDALDKEAVPEYYISYLQNPERYLHLVVRMPSVDAGNAGTLLRGAIKQVEKDLYIPKIETMQQLRAGSIAGQRFNMLLLGVFAAVALVLAAVGIYGVMSYSVSQRTREIGVRMALGAQQKDVLKLVVSHGMLLALSGVAIGLLASFFLTRLMSSLLYGVSATDPVTFVMISLILTGVALVACFVPARRAMKVDPMVALRYE